MTPLKPFTLNHQPMLEFVEHERPFGGTDVHIYRTLHPLPIAELAITLLGRALTAAQDDGEDSAGRQKLALQSPEQIAAR